MRTKTNLLTSAVHPRGGAPDWVFLIAGSANKRPDATPIRLGSTFLSLNHRVAANVKIVRDKVHMINMTNCRRNMDIVNMIIPMKPNLPC